MEDIYKYLKPVIGDAADLLALERELSIRKGVILLDPPAKDISENDIAIGNVAYGNKEHHPFGISAEELTNHCLIAGRTGAGQTNTSFQIISSLLK